MKVIFKKIADILSSKQKRIYSILVILTLIGMGLESIGLGILIPMITLIIKPTFLDNLSQDYGITIFENISYQNSLIIILCVMGGVYFFKTLYLTFLLDKQNKFIFGLNADISKSLYKKYLNQSYAFFLKTNTSEVTKNIMVEVQLLSKYFIAFMHVFNEGLLLTTVFLTLVFIEPIGVISIGTIFLVFGFLFFKATNTRVNLYGQKRKEYDGKISKLILEGYGGSKEIKLLNRNSFFTDQFDQLNDQKKIISANQSTLTQIPRLYIELLAVLAVVGLVGVMIFQNQNTSVIISKVGVFVVAVFRIIPSYSKISAAVQNIKYNGYALEVIHHKLKTLNNKPIPNKNAIEFKKKDSFKSVTFGYNTNEDNVLENITFEIKKGETIGFIGTSGSGKSTIIDLLNGLLQPNHGQIIIDDVPLQDCLKSWQEKIGYVPQQNFLTDSSIASNIAYAIKESDIDMEKLNNAIEKAQLTSFIKSLPNGINTSVGERGLQISGGQMQRIGIARALYNDPEVLIFDESTSALDEATEKSVLSSIRELKKSKTIIVISHRKNALADCDKIFNLCKGKIIHYNKNIAL